MNSKRIGKLVAIAILFCGFGQAQADTKCKDVQIEFKNSSKKKIRVVKYKYYDREDGKWRTEVTSNKECSPNVTCTTNEDDLELL